MFSLRGLLLVPSRYRVIGFKSLHSTLNSHFASSVLDVCSEQKNFENDYDLLEQYEVVRSSGSNRRNIIEVTNDERAAAVLKSLRNSHIVWACDTEVDGIDLKTQGPVGNGHVTCISIYGGPTVDFGIDGYEPGSTLWIDNIDDSEGMLRRNFKEWLEDSRYRKVWHNYGFDRHVMYNEGIDCQGFAGDMMN